MKAIVYTAPGEFTYTDVPMPTLRPDDVLMRVRACGLCRTDMHIHNGHFISEFPLTNGHEFTGEIVETGPEAPGDFAIGDRVVADNTELCGHCSQCRRDNPL
ncbi:MAG TPA: chlorophyll synthesis pathway protein BchC, partial [Phycisphaerae bacterium]|nr:chlorophyll synthesis pathway protein BchC [Phycisphaerae bacterium]